MTAATPTLTAKIGTATLGCKSAEVTLDSSKAPHVNGTAVFSYNAAVLAALDPRQSTPPRVVLTVSAGIPRVFDLGVRDREIDLNGSTITLTLASDEAMLQDYAPLADDVTPLSYQASLAALVGYVLGKAITGATLSAGPDSPIRALADAQNLIRNPRGANNGTDWSSTWTSGGVSLNRYPSGGPSYAPTYMQVYANVAASAGVYVFVDENATRVAGSRRYALSVAANPPAGKTINVDAILYDANGSIVSFATPVNIVGTGAWQRVTVEFWTTSTTAKVRPRVNIGAMAYGAYFGITAWRLSEYTGDPTDTGYWDGGTAGTAEYEYGFTDQPHASISTRRAVLDAPAPDALLWKAGANALEFLLPLVQSKGLRLVCDESRTWTLREATYAATGTVTIRDGVNMSTATERISRDEGVWCDAAAVRYKWRDRNGAQQERVEAYALTTPYSRLVTRDIAAAYPGPGRARYIVERAQGVGREVTVSTMADLTVRAEQSVSITLPDTPIQLGTVRAVTFDLEKHSMTVTARTSDLGARSINGLTGTINGLTGTINGL